jgi:hypothetical protein
MMSVKPLTDVRRQDIFVVTEFIKARKRGLPEDEAMAEAITHLYQELLRTKKLSKRPVVEPTQQGKIDLYKRLVDRMGEVFYINSLKPEIKKYLDRDVEFVDFADTVRSRCNRCC